MPFLAMTSDRCCRSHPCERSPSTARAPGGRRCRVARLHRRLGEEKWRAHRTGGEQDSGQKHGSKTHGGSWRGSIAGGRRLRRRFARSCAAARFLAAIVLSRERTLRADRAPGGVQAQRDGGNDMRLLMASTLVLVIGLTAWATAGVMQTPRGYRVPRDGHRGRQAGGALAGATVELSVKACRPDHDHQRQGRVRLRPTCRTALIRFGCGSQALVS